jgi:hypothetical protein
LEYAFDSKAQRVIVHVGRQSPQARVRIWKKIFSDPRWKSGYDVMLVVNHGFEPGSGLNHISHVGRLMQVAGVRKLAVRPNDPVAGLSADDGLKVTRSMGIQSKTCHCLQEMIDWVNS